MNEAQPEADIAIAGYISFALTVYRRHLLYFDLPRHSYRVKSWSADFADLNLDSLYTRLLITAAQTILWLPDQFASVKVSGEA